jgi:hypothetical protein
VEKALDLREQLALGNLHPNALVKWVKVDLEAIN